MSWLEDLVGDSGYSPGFEDWLTAPDFSYLLPGRETLTGLEKLASESPDISGLMDVYHGALKPIGTGKELVDAATQAATGQNAADLLMQGLKASPFAGVGPALEGANAVGVGPFAERLTHNAAEMATDPMMYLMPQSKALGLAFAPGAIEQIASGLQQGDQAGAADVLTGAGMLGGIGLAHAPEFTKGYLHDLTHGIGNERGTINLGDNRLPNPRHGLEDQFGGKDRSEFDYSLGEDLFDQGTVIVEPEVIKYGNGKEPDLIGYSVTDSGDIGFGDEGKAIYPTKEEAYQAAEKFRQGMVSTDTKPGILGNQEGAFTFGGKDFQELPPAQLEKLLNEAMTPAQGPDPLLQLNSELAKKWNSPEWYNLQPKDVRLQELLQNDVNKFEQVSKLESPKPVEDIPLPEKLTPEEQAAENLATPAIDPFEDIPIGQLDAIKEYDRAQQPKLSPDEYARLKEDIAANGIKTPLTVDMVNGEPKLAEGNTRLQIAKELGIEKLPVEGLTEDLQPTKASELLQPKTEPDTTSLTTVVNSMKEKYGKNWQKKMTPEESANFEAQLASVVKGESSTKFRQKVYRGTTSPGELQPTISENGTYGEGYYFTNNPDYAASYAKGDLSSLGIGPGKASSPTIKEGNISLDNPLHLDKPAPKSLKDIAYKKLPEQFHNNISRGSAKDVLFSIVENSNEISPLLKSLGYDGIVAQGGHEIVAFDKGRFSETPPASPTKEALPPTPEPPKPKPTPLQTVGPIARATLPAREVLSKASSELGARAENYRLLHETAASADYAKIEQAQRALGSKASEQRVGRFLDGQNVVLTPKEASIAKVMRLLLDDVAQRARDEGVLKGYRKNYFTHLIDATSKTPEGFYGKEGNAIGEKQFGPLEKAREGSQGPMDFSLNTLKKYVLGANRRIAEAKYLAPEEVNPMLRGQRARLGTKEFTQAQDTVNYASKYLRALTGREKAPGPVERFSGRLRYLTALGDLGKAAISQFGQAGQTYATVGIRRATRAALKTLGDYKGQEMQALSNGSLWPTVVHEMRNVFGDAGLLKDYMHGVGTTDKWLRVHADVAGRLLAQDALRGNSYAVRQLKELGLSVKDPELVAKAGKAIADKTQFRTDVSHLPLWAHSPLGKMAMQYNTFMYQHGLYVRNLFKHPIKNSGQIARLAVMGAILGEGIGGAKASLNALIPSDNEERNIIDRMLEGIAGDDNFDSKSWMKKLQQVTINKRIPFSSPGWRVLQNLSQIGGLGIFQSLMEKAAKPSEYPYLALGPSGKNLFDLTQAIAGDIGQSVKQERLMFPRKTARFGVQNAPIPIVNNYKLANYVMPNSAKWEDFPIEIPNLEDFQIGE